VASRDHVEARQKIQENQLYIALFALSQCMSSINNRVLCYIYEAFERIVDLEQALKDMHLSHDPLLPNVDVQ